MKIPPQSISSENSLIASILLSTELIPKVIEKIEPWEFYNTNNKNIFTEIIALYDDGQNPDIALISENLKSKHEIDIHLAEIFEGETYKNVNNLVKIIKQHAIRRKVIEETSLIQQQMYIGEDVGGGISQIERLNEQLDTYSINAGVKRRRMGKRVYIKDVKSEVEIFWETGKEKLGIPFNSWPKFSTYYRLVKGTINVLNGIPTHGKSSFVDAMMIESIINHKWKWAIFSPENKPYYLHIQPLIEKFTGKPFFGDGAISRAELNDALDKLNNHIVFIEPDDENRTLKAIKKLILESIKTFNIDAVFLDPWNKIEMVQKKDESETQYIARSLLDLQYMARSNNIYVGIVAHPAKMEKGIRGVKYGVPTLYNLSGGANWYNATDNGITIYRDFKNDYIEIHIQKIKFKNHGEMGVCFFRYDNSNGRFYEISKSETKKKTEAEDFTVPEEKEQVEIWQDKI